MQDIGYDGNISTNTSFTCTICNYATPTYSKVLWERVASIWKAHAWEYQREDLIPRFKHTTFTLKAHKPYHKMRFRTVHTSFLTLPITTTTSPHKTLTANCHNRWRTGVAELIRSRVHYVCHTWIP